jgi:dihydroflavonol-4-reductase
MKVMVTGGTGFVGSHTVAELVRNGHQVKLLVRNIDRVKPALEPLGVGEVETVVGDVTDQRTVEQAAEGCDATMHCGSVYSLDSRAAERINKTNVQGTDIVLGTAQKLGHDPIVHVSSFVALIGVKNAVLSPDSTPRNPRGAYIVSKADSDRVARRFQDAGAPVVITYPGSVWGPYDPHLGESCQMAENMLRRFWSVIPRGIVPITDVRDLAKMHAAVMEKGRGQRRYIAPATNINLNKAIASISSVTGRNLPTVSLPVWLLSWPMQTLDWLQHVTPFRFPFNYQAVYVTGLSSRMDDSLTRNDFGIVPRPLEDTFADTIRWMAQAGHLPDKLAGRLVKTS